MIPVTQELKGKTVVIPAGTLVRSMNPSKPRWTTARKQTVKVHHVLNGWHVFPHMLSGSEIQRMADEDGVDFSEYLQLKFDLDFARLRYEEGELSKEVLLALERQFYSFSVLRRQPTVVWAGAGRYWCEAPVVEAVIDAEVPLIAA